MAEWTPTMVEDRLESAADVFRSLPEVKPQGYFNAWPEYFHSFADQVGQEPRMRRPKPGPRDITQAEDALLWLRWLDPADARLLWLRANRKPWKPICWELGHQPRHREPALAVRDRGDRLAAEREAGAAEAVDGVRGGAGGALSLSRLDSRVRQFPARHRTARRIAPLTLSMAIYSGSCARANRR